MHQNGQENQCLSIFYDTVVLGGVGLPELREPDGVETALRVFDHMLHDLEAVSIEQGVVFSAVQARVV